MMKAIRTALFVPGTRPERFIKALESGADAVIVDLEDAVEAPRKVEARTQLQNFIQEYPGRSILVRVNAATTQWFEDDIKACEAGGVDGILLPKAESAQQVERVAASGKPVLPIIESAAGVLALHELAAAAGVSRLSFGSLDLMLELGTTPDTVGAQRVLDHIRCQILLHSAACGLASPLDGVYPDFRNTNGLAAVARQVCDMGFGGMLCIHPMQVPVIASVFTPDQAELDWAGRIVELADQTGSSAFQMDGNMVDAPVIARARRLLQGV